MPIPSITKCNFKGSEAVRCNSYYNDYSQYASTLSRSDVELMRFIEQQPVRFESFVNEYIRLWEEALVKNNETHEQNLPLIAEMDATIADVTAYMILKGFPATYTVPKPGSRARFPPRVTMLAGYRQDIDRLFIRQDGYAESVRLCNQHIETGKDILRKGKALLERKEQEERKKRESNKKFFELTKINEELGNPNDWNDGCGSVECNIFSTSNETEEEIVKDVSEAIEGFHECQDGRVFRDTKWSYDAIFVYVKESDSATYDLFAKVRDLIDS